MKKNRNVQTGRQENMMKETEFAILISGLVNIGNKKGLCKRKILYWDVTHDVKTELRPSERR